jgi:RNA polymerase sigma-54 factor
MGFQLKQSLKLGQSLLMTPQLQQAIKLLQLSRMELEQFVANELAENPCLEEGALESSEESVLVEKERESTAADAAQETLSKASEIVDKVGDEKAEVDWEALARHQESITSTPSTKSSAAGEDAPNYENMVSRVDTLQEFLAIQIGELDFDDEEKRIATLIIGNIDDRGYLTTTIEDISKEENFTHEQIDDILDTIQRLEPLGVGARDLRECLHIQLRMGRLKNGIVEKIIDNHLSELENRNFQVIAKSLKITIEQVIENVQIIAELEPVPGRQFGENDAQYVIPDVYVFKLGNEWVVNLNEDGLPQLRVSPFYEQLMKDKEEKLRKAEEEKKKEEEKQRALDGEKAEEKNYVTEKMKSAEWLIKSIRQRQRTIFKVTESIVERQKDFFEHGVEYLKPMILKDIAEDISMHESTISRVTNNKFVHTPRGVFELKYFFNSSVSRSDGQDAASESVKRMISDIVKEENVKKPYSDQKIVDMLDEKGIQLARRTVAKYREQLGILPSSKRKKYF